MSFATIEPRKRTRRKRERPRRADAVVDVRQSKFSHRQVMIRLDDDERKKTIIRQGLAHDDPMSRALVFIQGRSLREFIQTVNFLSSMTTHSLLLEEGLLRIVDTFDVLSR